LGAKEGDRMILQTRHGRAIPIVKIEFSNGQMEIVLELIDE
tara:strand:- start:358 stop:480 length:123 start_codon:yes stop_codon:yes gene_type:complete